MLTSFINIFKRISKTPPSSPSFKEERVLSYVINNAKEGSPQDVLNKIDEFCIKEPMMNVGPVKGQTLIEGLKKYKPQVCVEYGAYIGYSGILIGMNLAQNQKMYSIEVNPLYAAISTKMIEYAGLQDRVKVLVGTAQTKLDELNNKYGVDQINFLFIDHWKPLYISDFQFTEQKGMLKSGSVVMADNIIKPGAPEYLAMMQANNDYTNTLHESVTKGTRDAVLVSIKK